MGLKLTLSASRFDLLAWSCADESIYKWRQENSHWYQRVDSPGGYWSTNENIFTAISKRCAAPKTTSGREPHQLICMQNCSCCSGPLHHSAGFSPIFTRWRGGSPTTPIQTCAWWGRSLGLLQTGASSDAGRLQQTYLGEVTKQLTGCGRLSSHRWRSAF